MLAVHWKAPLRLTQAYLIYCSALMALMLVSLLPDWTAWMLLGVISVWDLVAVLCPYGPLNLLVKEAQKEDSPPIMNALIYSTVVLTADDDKLSALPKQEDGSAETVFVDHTDDVGSEPSSPAASTSSAHQTGNPALPQTQKMGQGMSRLATNRAADDDDDEEEDEEEESKPKLGLGDFIFYSVLCAKAAQQEDMGTVIACVLTLTLSLRIPPLFMLHNTTVHKIYVLHMCSSIICCWAFITI